MERNGIFCFSTLLLKCQATQDIPANFMARFEELRIKMAALAEDGDIYDLLDVYPALCHFPGTFANGECKRPLQRWHQKKFDDLGWGLPAIRTVQQRQRQLRASENAMRFEAG